MGEVVGWAALSPVSGRDAATPVSSSTASMLRADARTGIGRALLDTLIAGAEAAGIWTIQTGSSPRTWLASHCTKRAASASSARASALRSCDGVWRDIVFLERRSNLG